MIYDRAYHEEYVRRSRSDLGRRIYRARWDFVTRHVAGGSLLDYGCGAGGFHLLAPEAFPATGYDVNPFSGFDTTPTQAYDILTMWDVIEHLPDPTEPLVRLAPAWLFLSTPNVEAADDVLAWKHFKPGEHLHYFSEKSIEAVLGCAGYRVVEFDYAEGALRDPEAPRAILSAAARRA